MVRGYQKYDATTKKYYVYHSEQRIESTPDANVAWNGPEGEGIDIKSAARLIREGYNTFSQELIKRANWGGKRREGVKTTTISGEVPIKIGKRLRSYSNGSKILTIALTEYFARLDNLEKMALEALNENPS